MSDYCPNCGSRIVFGGPRCCDGGASKREREKARADSLEIRLAHIESRLDALEIARLRARVAEVPGT